MTAGILFCRRRSCGIHSDCNSVLTDTEILCRWNEWSCKGLTRAADKLWLCVGLLYESENLDTAVPFYVNRKVLQNMGKVRYGNEKSV